MKALGVKSDKHRKKSDKHRIRNGCLSEYRRYGILKTGRNRVTVRG